MRTQPCRLSTTASWDRRKKDIAYSGSLRPSKKSMPEHLTGWNRENCIPGWRPATAPSQIRNRSFMRMALLLTLLNGTAVRGGSRSQRLRQWKCLTRNGLISIRTERRSKAPWKKPESSSGMPRVSWDVRSWPSWVS